MHDMHGASMAWSPMWLRIAWAVVLCGVIVAHLGHAAAMPGQRRWWHAGHTIMASGMALMYLLPHMHFPGLYRAGLVLFVLVTVIETSATGAFRAREGAFNPLWVFSTADMVAMTYMLLPMALRPTWLNWVFVLYLGGQTLAWGFGAWDRLPVFARRPAPAAPQGSPAATGRAQQHEHAVTPLADAPALQTAAGPVLGLAAHSTVAVRVTLAIMTASMAYMLAIM